MSVIWTLKTFYILCAIPLKYVYLLYCNWGRVVMDAKAQQRVKIKVLFFAKARELSGIKESDFISDSPTSYELLLQQILDRYSLSAIKNSVVLAINEEYCSPTAHFKLNEGDEVAVIPPLSGDKGKTTTRIMDYVKVVHSKLSLEETSELVSSPSCGAISIFMGTTRDTFENKQVVQLEYEAYEPMAVKAMQKVCDDIREKWQVENIAIYHRLGIVPVKEASVVIAVSSPHRAESLQAVQFAIDTLKSSIPIWKKEVYSTKETEWKENKECAWKTPLDSSENETNEGKDVTECKDDIHNVLLDDVSSNLVQIKASTDEIKRRINSFIERKREQVNLGNIQDFCYHGEESVSENSCARVDALLIRRKDSKSHLRVRRVLNTWGPQTRGLDPGSMGTPNPQDPAKFLIHGSTSEPKEKQESGCPQGINERLLNAEYHLTLEGPVPADVYCRLKRIEDRILFLEGISPEYFSFWGDVHNENDSKRSPQKKKRTYSNAEIEQKIQDLQYKLALKQK